MCYQSEYLRNPRKFIKQIVQFIGYVLQFGPLVGYFFAISGKTLLWKWPHRLWDLFMVLAKKWVWHSNYRSDLFFLCVPHFFIFMYSHHIWLSYMVIVYVHHILATYFIITYYHHVLLSYVTSFYHILCIS